MLVEIDEEESELGLDFLSTNIRKVRKYVERKCAAGDTTYDSLYKPMMKLSDHLSLEIARYSHFISQNRQIMDLTDKHQDLQAQLAETTERLHEATAKLDQANARFSQTEIKLTDAETKLTDAETKLKTIETDLPTAKSDLDTVKKSLASIHIDIIAVLSIFASIVLTFSGSMTVLGSALTGMQEVHAFKATFFVLLCGLVLGNVIFVMMHLVGKLTDRSIYVPCKTKQCSCENNKTPECRGLTRLRKRLPYIFWLNVILISLMFFDVVIWILENHFNFIR
jgi:exonuclease VII small subunit